MKGVDVLRSCLLGAGAALLAVSPALAARASDGFVFTADDGERNKVVVTWEGSTAHIRDPGAPRILGCTPLDLGFQEVRCQTPRGGPLGAFAGCDPCDADVFTLDGDDSARILDPSQSAGSFVNVYGGVGDDTLYSEASLGFTDGGPGNDHLTGRYLMGGTGNDALNGTSGDDQYLEGGPGSDTIKGNGGSDTAIYYNAGRSLRITLDDKANDGAEGERDNVQTENVRGGKNDDVLIGNGVANTLDGGDGDDRLSGAGGPDTLYADRGRDTLDGGPGNDELHAFDNVGGPDSVTCGAGDDVAFVSKGAVVADDCERVYVIGREARQTPRLKIGGPDRPRAKGGVLRLPITAFHEFAPWPGEEGPAIGASATLRAVRHKPGGVLAHGTVGSLAAPGTAEVVLKLNRGTRRQLRKRRKIRMRVEIGARDADGRESLTRRIVTVRR